MSVSPEQRYTPDRPCPVCGGHEGLARGGSSRCHGYISSNGRYAFCSQRAVSDKLDTGASGLHRHRLGRKCECGKKHTVPTHVLERIKAARSRPQKLPKVTILGRPTQQQFKCVFRSI